MLMACTCARFDMVPLAATDYYPSGLEERKENAYSIIIAFWPNFNRRTPTSLLPAALLS